MKLTNRLGLPQAIINALSVDEYSRGSANISVTGLTSPPRQQALQNAHGDELEEDASDQIFALLGKAVHKILEVAGEADPTTITEKRYFMRVPGPLGEWTVSGQTDSIDLESLGDGTVSIDDWKTAKVAEIQFGVKEEREQQLNVYKVLLEANGFKVGRLRDIFILRDWSKVQAAREHSGPSLTGAPVSDYPESQVVVHEVRIWSQQEAVDYILGRVALHQQAQAAYRADIERTVQSPGDFLASRGVMPQGSLPECSDDERWAQPAWFAVMEEGKPRASRVFDTEAEAEQYAQKHTAPFEEYETVLTKEGGPVKVFKAGSKRASKVLPTQAEADDWVESQQKTSEYRVVPRPSVSTRCVFYCSVSSICEQFRAMREVAPDD